MDSPGLVWKFQRWPLPKATLEFDDLIFGSEMLSVCYAVDSSAILTAVAVSFRSSVHSGGNLLEIMQGGMYQQER